MNEKKICFLIPYYNHPKKISKLIGLLDSYNLPILLIDDGSDKQSKEVLENIQSSLLTIYTRKQNGGKGAAVKSGFELAKKMGFWSCFQIDADMQHDLSKIPFFLQEWKKNPNSMICGNPQYGIEAPKARLYGRKITDFWVYINTLGGDLKDVMCGMRIYPIEKMQRAIKQTKSNRMDFDIEILLYAYRENLSFTWIDVDVVYDKNNTSHFSALKDNLKISRVHAKHFFAIPFAYIQKKRNAKKEWWKKKERANMMWLKITLICVTYLPQFILKFLIFFVCSFFCFFSKKERDNLAIFKQALQEYFPNDDFKKLSSFQHFYAFGECVCDKFAVWSKKIKYQDLLFVNGEQKNKAFMQKRGRIILVSHFGNTEVARAMERQKGRASKMNILVHSRNAKEFAQIINQISGVNFGIFEVEDLNVSKMIELKECIERGESIGIMGDRISLNQNQSKNVEVNFLGRSCLFPSGAFLLAGMLECPISMLWCEKIGDRYLVTFEELSEKIILTRDKTASIRPFLQTYIHSLEQKIRNNPTQWFNFFNIWEQGR